jgi:transcriptional regulator of acetoin/glycerol metabolism
MSNSGNPRLSALLVLNEQKAINYIIDALRENNGSITDTANELLVARQTMYKYFQKYPALKRAYERILYDVRERDKARPRVMQ